jgi:hypothetical protein
MTCVQITLRSSMASLGLLAVSLVYTSPVWAEPKGAAIDMRGAYPLVLNSGPGDSRYQGDFALDGRFLVFGETFGGGIGLEHYWLSNRVPAHGAISSQVNAGATVFPLHFVVMALPGHEGTYIGNLFFVFSLGLASRSIGGVDGSMLAWTAAAEVDWFLHLGKHSPFFVGPSAALGFISDGRDSNVGALDLFNLGLRIGISSRD